MCRRLCPADANDDQVVDVADLIILLQHWGPCGACPGDLDFDGVVGTADVVLLLAAWGECPRRGP